MSTICFSTKSIWFLVWWTHMKFISFCGNIYLLQVVRTILSKKLYIPRGEHFDILSYFFKVFGLYAPEVHVLLSCRWTVRTLMTGIFNSRPPKPKYNFLCDTKKYLNMLMVYLINDWICQLSYYLINSHTPCLNSSIKWIWDMYSSKIHKSRLGQIYRRIIIYCTFY